MSFCTLHANFNHLRLPIMLFLIRRKTKLWQTRTILLMVLQTCPCTCESREVIAPLRAKPMKKFEVARPVTSLDADLVCFSFQGYRWMSAGRWDVSEALILQLNIETSTTQWSNHFSFRTTWLERRWVWTWYTLIPSDRRAWKPNWQLSKFTLFSQTLSRLHIQYRLRLRIQSWHLCPIPYIDGRHEFHLCFWTRVLIKIAWDVRVFETKTEGITDGDSEVSHHLGWLKGKL